MQNYNTQLTAIQIPEYGRNLQQLVEYCKSIPDRQQRTRYAYGIVEIMADIYPEAAGVDKANKHVLWDHLAIIANHELDIDYPFPVMTEEKLSDRPEPLHNPQNPYIHWRMYGKMVEDIIKKAMAMTDAQQRIRLFELCANHMKLQFLKTHPNAEEDDNKIIQDLIEYTQGKYQDEIYKVFLYSAKELQKNTQYDPTKLVVSTKKKKKKKK